ncbi:MAG TPA: LLM class flavin-dependent oxidoreductase [Acidimicrobiales bacterium]|nr:LLM class flavin-dependent oxidoreductase [Acidimicrobiales bacterium]
MRNPPAWPRPWPAHYGRWLERVEEADRLGAAAVWLTEHHFFDDGYLPQCWTLAAAIASRTSRIRIGTAVALLPLHSALETAEQIALVDVISGGRVEPGFGVGYRKPEYLAFGGDFKHRYRVFAERIRELRRLWGEQPGAERTVTPAPVQTPMPMWGGFAGPMGARTAGRLGLGLQSIDRRLLGEYSSALQAAGHDPGAARMAGQVEFFVADDPDRAWAQIGEHVAYRWASYNRYMFEGTRREAEAPHHFDPAAIRDRFLIGTPAEIAAAIRSRIDGLPVTDVYCWSDFPGMPDDLVDQHLELMFTKVAPLVP